MMSEPNSVRAMYELAWQHQADGLLIIDNQQTIVATNPAARQLLNDPQLTSGANLNQLPPPLVTLIQKEPGEYDITIDADTLLPRLLHVTCLIPPANPQHHLFLLRDITMIQQQQQQLQYHQQLFAHLVTIARIVAEGVNNPDETIHSILEMVRELTQATDGSIFLCQADGTILHSIIAPPHPTKNAIKDRITTAMKSGLAGWVFDNREAVVIADSNHDNRWIQFPEQEYIARSVLCIPINHDRDIIGLITLTHHRPNFFDNEKQQLVGAITGYIAHILVKAKTDADQKQLLQQLAVAKARAEAANRAKSTFLANMTHELRTPLTSIMSYSDVGETLASRQDLPQFPVIFQKIKNGAWHLLDLINNLLDLSNLESGNITLQNAPLDLKAFAQAITYKAAPLFEKTNVAFSVQVDNNLPPLTIDQTRLDQLIMNFLENAAKFTPLGHVTFTTTQAPHPHHPTADNYILFIITDTGIGIPPDQIQTLFDSFTQADTSLTRQYGGAGIGLAINYRLCQLMGGEIIIDSILETGTTITLCFPLTP
ncbi:MAG TPA: ATP-binding protein [Anaerolineae bacterium]|nr:ATP-binding protein [Anaerolineae bacterium]